MSDRQQHLINHKLNRGYHLGPAPPNSDRHDYETKTPATVSNTHTPESSNRTTSTSNAQNHHKFHDKFPPVYCCLRDLQINHSTSQHHHHEPCATTLGKECPTVTLSRLPNAAESHLQNQHLAHTETICFVSEACDCDTPPACPDPECTVYFCEDCSDCDEECDEEDCLISCKATINLEDACPTAMCHYNHDYKAANFGDAGCPGPVRPGFDPTLLADASDRYSSTSDEAAAGTPNTELSSAPSTKRSASPDIENNQTGPPSKNRKIRRELSSSNTIGKEYTDPKKQRRFEEKKREVEKPRHEQETRLKQNLIQAVNQAVPLRQPSHGQHYLHGTGELPNVPDPLQNPYLPVNGNFQPGLSQDLYHPSPQFQQLSDSGAQYGEHAGHPRAYLSNYWNADIPLRSQGVVTASGPPGATYAYMPTDVPTTTTSQSATPVPMAGTNAHWLDFMPTTAIPRDGILKVEGPPRTTFRCNFPKCDNAHEFTNLQSAQEHYKHIHMGGGFGCSDPHCHGKIWANKAGVNKHLKSVHGVRPKVLRCKHCGKSDTRSDNHRRHELACKSIPSQ